MSHAAQSHYFSYSFAILNLMLRFFTFISGTHVASTDRQSNKARSFDQSIEKLLAVYLSVYVEGVAVLSTLL